MFKKNASFASAMGLFSKAQAELRAAQAINDKALAEAKATVVDCEAEASNIDRAAEFLDSILG